ncbi:MAG: hypothetical protein NTW94_02440 [Legionellales bacterium]|nr:hypothetical protein [Legionellales bacterium]
MARVYYWQGVTGDFGRFAPYQSTILLLLQGEYKALNLERLRSASRHPIYSIRINSADRILFTTFAGKACLLDVVLEHRYAGSAFLKKGVLNTFLSTYEDAVFEAAEGLDLETVEETEALSVAPLAYFQSQFIELSLLQQTAVRASLPMIVTGPAGSGKTCLALSMLSNYCRAHRDEPMPVLYVCQSEALKRLVQAGWREIADETQFRTEVHFRTYDELIDDDKKGLATASDFSAWFEALPASAAEIKALGPKLVWREFRICSGDTTERYLQLGQRQSELSVPGVRTLLSEYYVKYLNHLHDKRLFSAELFPLETRSHYAFVAVDEAQGLSNLQLKSLCQLARGQIVYFLGVHQLLSDCKSHLFYLKELFRNASIEVTTVSLTATYRCPKRILDVANQLILLKKICTGGAEDKDEIPAMCVANDARADQGEAMLFRVEDAEAIGRLRELAKNNIQFAVVTLPLFKEEAKERFETPLIFTAEEIKGLEFKEVVIWKLFGDEDFRTAGKKLRGMDLEKVPKHRPKAGESDVSHAVPFNRAIIAVTRSSGQLYLFQKWDRDIDPIMRSIQSACRGTAIRADIRVEPVSPDQWKAQAAHLQAQGLTEQARAIYIDVLGLSEAEFVASHSSPKSDIEAHIEAGESAAVIVAGAPAGGSADTSVHDISKPARAALRLKRKKDTPSRADGAGAAEVSPTSALTLESLCRKCISLIHRLPKEKLYCDEVCPQILDLFIAYDSFLKEAELRAWFIKALSVNRDVLYMLCQSPEGIRKLRQLWRVEKDLIAAVSISTWIHVFSDKPRDHAKDSLLYKLSASEDGIYILYALLLTHPNLFRTIPSFAWGANTNTASGKNGYSPLFFLSGNEMGQQFLLSFFEKFP